MGEGVEEFLGGCWRGEDEKPVEGCSKPQSEMARRSWGFNNKSLKAAAVLEKV